MSRWRILLFKLLLIVPSLTALEVLSIFIFNAGLASLLYPDLVPEYGWTLGFFVAASLVLFIFGLGARRRFLRSRHGPKASPLAQSVPIALTHECLIFKHSRTNAAIGFVTVDLGWQAHTDSLLSTLARVCKQVERLAIVAAYSVTGQQHAYVMIRAAAENQREVIRRITVAGRALAQSLSHQGIAAEWVHDSLGVEQLYWMCVLGKEFHEDVTLDYGDGTLQARVGSGSTRALAAASVPLESVATRDGLLNLRSETPPHMLLLHLSPLDSSVIRKQLYKLSAARPETLALIDTLGPNLALETLAGQLNPDKCSAITDLYRGCREGLWQCACHLICAPQDLEAFAAQLGCDPVLLEPQGFGEVATIASSANTSAALLPTTRLVQLLRGLEPPGQEPSAQTSAGGLRDADRVAELVSKGGAPP